jgi:hypothetical protein
MARPHHLPHVHQGCGGLVGEIPEQREPVQELLRRRFRVDCDIRPRFQLAPSRSSFRCAAAPDIRGNDAENRTPARLRSLTCPIPCARAHCSLVLGLGWWYFVDVSRAFGLEGSEANKLMVMLPLSLFAGERPAHRPRSRAR